MEIAGKTLSLSDIKIPVYNLATREDHIAPARSVFLGGQYFGGDVTYVMSGSGHIAGVVNPESKKKYQYWTGPKPVGDLETWLSRAEENPGSWWPNWQEWIEKNDAQRVPARQPGEKTQILDEAPGTYVRVRV
jgi:polyhydroxyalkanoate synthase